MEHENIVGVIKGTDKLKSFDELLAITHFDETLMQAFEKSKKEKKDFKIIIKPNMMVFVNRNNFLAVVTEPELVEHLVDHIIQLGFTSIVVCEAQNDVGRMLKNHVVQFVSEQIGYKPNGRYKIADLTLESETFFYQYKDKNGNLKAWKDKVGKSWRDADFRITFAKCKTHEHDWMTLGLKNVYGCFPRADKVAKYHIKKEVFDITAWSVRNLPLHFSFIDGWIASDGFQGYKIAHPRDLKMLFGGKDAVAVDIEVFKRAGIDPTKPKFVTKTAEQINDGKLPSYSVAGDQNTMFKDICTWENIEDSVVKKIDVLEEVYIAWGFINLKAISQTVDYDIFPPKNPMTRVLVWLSKKLYWVFKLFKSYRKLYEHKPDK